MKRITILAALALLGGCMAGGQQGYVEQMQLQTIRYTTSPCFGACPVYSVTVGRDGHGVFEGKQHTTVTGERDFAVTDRQFQDFMRALARYRPTTGEEVHKPGTNCGPAATDQQSVEVVWTRGDGERQRLYHYFGCDRRKYAALVDTLKAAPQALPIQDMIGRH